MFAGAPKKDAKSAQKTKDASTENGDSSEGKKKSPEKVGCEEFVMWLKMILMWYAFTLSIVGKVGDTTEF